MLCGSRYNSAIISDDLQNPCGVKEAFKIRLSPETASSFSEILHHYTDCTKSCQAPPPKSSLVHAPRCLITRHGLPLAAPAIPRDATHKIPLRGVPQTHSSDARSQSPDPGSPISRSRKFFPGFPKFPSRISEATRQMTEAHFQI